MLKRIFSESLFYALGPHIPRVVSLLLLPLFTNYLTAIDYGISATVMVYTGLLFGVKDLGITVLAINSFYHFKKNWLLRWKIYYGYLLAWSPLLFIAAFILVYLTMPAQAAGNRIVSVLLVTLPFLLFEHTITMGFRYLQTVTRNARKVAMISFIAGFVTLVVTYIGIVEMKAGYLGWFMGAFAGSFISTLFYLPVVLKAGILPVFYTNRHFFRREMRVALPMIPHTYASYLLNSSDRFVMSTLNVPVRDMGLYNLAYSFGNYADVAGNSIGLAVGPVINEHISERKEQAESALRKLVFFLQGLFVFGLAALTVWFREIFEILISNEELQQAYPLAIIIVMAYAYRPVYWSVMNRLFLAKKTDKLWRISFGAGLLNVILNFSLIPLFGYEVAALNSFISFMVLGFGGFLLKDFRQQSTLNYFPLIWILVISACTAISYLLRDSTFLMKGIYSFILLFMILISLWRYRKG